METTSATFASLGLVPRIVENLQAMGYRRPRPVQAEAIPLLLDGRDAVALAQTGTGKTVAYAAPLVQRAIEGSRPRSKRGRPGPHPGALVIVPTRELAEQIAAETGRVARRAGVRVLAVFGKVGMREQAEAAAKGVDVLVGTPGRLRNLLDAGAIALDAVRVVVLDEADRMMDMGFRPQVDALLGLISGERQTVLMSATMPASVASLAERYLRDPVRIEIGRHTTAVEHVDQRLISVHNRDKVPLLLRLLADEHRTGVLVFCRTRRRVGWVGTALRRQGIRTDMIHGDRTQAQRRRILDRFAKGDLDVVVATDVAARGLHIPSVTTVIQYDVPNEPEEYVHRLGRAAHGGGHGVAITLLSRVDELLWDAIVDRVGVLLPAETVEGFAADRAASSALHEPQFRRTRVRKAKSNPSRGRSGKSRPIKPGEKPGGGVIRPSE